ncbi:MAG TPA: glucose-1-phosphate cytidylyltransferase [Candidatus Synoicihabitans sp.]|nr:glucose-1-phosphate cytidylyltransferase [Candidatus Synoicihabitans sp.]
MKTVILCGGKGTRLREETEFRPKPMVPIGSRPILWHIMRHFARFGHDDFVLCLGYRGELIKEWFRNYRWHTSDVTVRLGDRAEPQFHREDEGVNWRVTLCDTGLETLTAGRVRAVAQHLQPNEPFFLTYGDGVGNVNLEKLLEFHRQSGAVCTLTAVHPPGRFGEIGLDTAGRVETFNEKPQTEAGFINGGFMVCQPALLAYLPEDNAVMLEEGPLRQLAAEGKLAAYRHHGFWQPMDTYQEFALLNRLWATGEAPWLA